MRNAAKKYVILLWRPITNCVVRLLFQMLEPKIEEIRSPLKRSVIRDFLVRQYANTCKIPSNLFNLQKKGYQVFESAMQPSAGNNKPGEAAQDRYYSNEAYQEEEIVDQAPEGDEESIAGTECPSIIIGNARVEKEEKSEGSDGFGFF